tara:strand:- start:696 stop:959 length:264 start_codon:yes stop_codon:yes gene_type:complete
MSYSHEIKEIIKKNNVLMRKKGLLTELLDHTEVQKILEEVVNNKGERLEEGNRKQNYELITLLRDSKWNLDISIDKYIKKIHTDASI